MDLDKLTVEDRVVLAQSSGLLAIFEDPISFEIMEKAMMTPCGHSFSEETITNWIAKKNHCPICNKTLKRSDVTPNYALRNAIARFITAQAHLQQNIQHALGNVSVSSDWTTPTSPTADDWKTPEDGVPTTSDSKLLVEVISARDLKTDWFGNSDPYCVLEFQEQKRKTTVQYKNRNPTWSEVFVFNVVNLHAESNIVLTVWDKESILKDKFIGMVTVPFAEVITTLKIVRRFVLQKKRVNSRKKIVGDILLRLQFLDLRANYEFGRSSQSLPSISPMTSRLSVTPPSIASSLPSPHSHSSRNLPSPIPYVQPSSPNPQPPPASPHRSPVPSRRAHAYPQSPAPASPASRSSAGQGRRGSSRAPRSSLGASSHRYNDGASASDVASGSGSSGRRRSEGAASGSARPERPERRRDVIGSAALLRNELVQSNSAPIFPVRGNEAGDENSSSSDSNSEVGAGASEAIMPLALDDENLNDQAPVEEFVAELEAVQLEEEPVPEPIQPLVEPQVEREAEPEPAAEAEENEEEEDEESDNDESLINNNQRNHDNNDDDNDNDNDNDNNNSNNNNSQHNNDHFNNFENNDHFDDQQDDNNHEHAGYDQDNGNRGGESLENHENVENGDDIEYIPNSTFEDVDVSAPSDAAEGNGYFSEWHLLPPPPPPVAPAKEGTMAVSEQEPPISAFFFSGDNSTPPTLPSPLSQSPGTPPISRRRDSRTNSNASITHFISSDESRNSTIPSPTPAQFLSHFSTSSTDLDFAFTSVGMSPSHVRKSSQPEEPQTTQPRKLKLVGSTGIRDSNEIARQMYEELHAQQFQLQQKESAPSTTYSTDMRLFNLDEEDEEDEPEEQLTRERRNNAKNNTPSKPISHNSPVLSPAVPSLLSPPPYASSSSINFSGLFNNSSPRTYNSSNKFNTSPSLHHPQPSYSPSEAHARRNNTAPHPPSVYSPPPIPFLNAPVVAPLNSPPLIPTPVPIPNSASTHSTPSHTPSHSRSNSGTNASIKNNRVMRLPPPTDTIPEIPPEPPIQMPRNPTVEVRVVANEDSIRSLMEMGFERDLAEYALKSTNNDMEAALDKLLNNTGQLQFELLRSLLFT